MKTIHDIARELSISASTVSRALKNHPSISEETTNKVKDLAKKWGYRPNTLASGLRKSKTNMIGVVIPNVSLSFFSAAISGIQDIMHEAGYSVIICQSNNSYDREENDISALYSAQVDGIIVSMSVKTENYDHFKLFLNEKKTLVFFDSSPDALKASRVIGDDFDGAYKATEHLISQGYKKIAHIAGSQNSNVFRKRLGGYKKALEDYNLKFDEKYVVSSILTRDDGLKAAIKLMNIRPRPDAVFCANDLTAIALLQYAKGTGIKVPQKLGIVGYSNEISTSLIEPGITTVEQSAFEMGQEAARLFLKETNIKKNDDFEPAEIVFPVSLIERKSSRKIEQ